MKSAQTLERTLASIDGRGYAAYQQLRGEYDYGDYRLAIDHVQVDPYAPPSKARVVLGRDVAGLPDDLVDSRATVVAVADFLTRQFHHALDRRERAAKGTGNSGTVSIGKPGQEMLERTSVLITEDRVEARFEVGLPAAGRRVLGRAASRIFGETVPRVVDRALVYHNLDTAALREQVALYLDQEHLRAELDRRRLVAFVADGAVLPRRSGVSDAPLARGAVPFRSPEALAVEVDLPSGRTVTGMGIPEGVTVIVGGGYHGKSTLLRALERGVYQHIPGDGRELAITRPDAVTVRAEDGRPVEQVDIATFIDDLPGGVDTTRFSTQNASGSTSQATNLVEALAAGASLLLVDEDTSATNFMIRDDRMRQLVPAEKEPITPFIDRVGPLYREHGVSTVLVAGGSGAFFDVADHVIMMDAYVPRDVTAAAREIAHADARPAPPGVGEKFGPLIHRVPTASGLGDGRDTKTKARGRDTVQYGGETIDLSALAQLVDASQTASIALMLQRLAEQFVDGRRTLAEAVDALFEQVQRHGLDWLSPHAGHPGNLALPRRHEVHAAVNRYRRLAIDTSR